MKFKSFVRIFITFCLIFVHKDLFAYDHDDNVYEVNSKGISMKTTLNHRMWVKVEDSKEYKLVMAKDIIGKSVKYNSIGKYQTDNISYFNVEDINNKPWGVTIFNHTTTSKKECDEIQIHCQHFGMTSYYNESEYNGKTSIYDITICKDSNHQGILANSEKDKIVKL